MLGGQLEFCAAGPPSCQPERSEGVVARNLPPPVFLLLGFAQGKLREGVGYHGGGAEVGPLHTAHQPLVTRAGAQWCEVRVQSKICRCEPPGPRTSRSRAVIAFVRITHFHQGQGRGRQLEVLPHRIGTWTIHEHLQRRRASLTRLQSAFAKQSPRPKWFSTQNPIMVL